MEDSSKNNSNQSHQNQLSQTFFHGTKADLKAGDLLTAGFKSNYQSEITMNHIYFTALINGASLAAEFT